MEFQLVHNYLSSTSVDLKLFKSKFYSLSAISATCHLPMRLSSMEVVFSNF
jgi:hypothetical protein